MEFVIPDGLHEQLTIHVPSDHRFLGLERGDLIPDGRGVQLYLLFLAQGGLLVGGVDLCPVEFAIVVGV